MSLSVALSKSVSITAEMDGHGFGFDLINNFARSLATLNSKSRPSPSCCRDCTCGYGVFCFTNMFARSLSVLEASEAWLSLPLR